MAVTESAQNASVRPLLSVRKVSKTFGGEAALRNLSLDLNGGEILALVGQNGSGKSTLVKILTGYHEPDPGATVLVKGNPASFGHAEISSDEQRLPIHVVYQDGGLVLGLNAVDNIALMGGYRRAAGPLIDWKEQRRRTREALELVDAQDLDLDRAVGELKLIERAQIAIARAVSNWDDAGGLLLLDEPTSALTDHEVEHLFGILRRLRSANVSIVYVSHRLEEVLRIADRVAILCDGELVTTRVSNELAYDELVSLMIGSPEVQREGADMFPVPDTALAASTVSVTEFRSGAIKDLSFDLAPGEILGITGLAGSGHEEVPYLLVGATQADHGAITINGESIDARAMMPRMAVALGLALVPADRLADGLIQGFSVEENISLPRLSKFARRGWLSFSSERQYAADWIERLGIDPPNPDAPVLSLSGGNQQKVVMSRSLGVAHTALLLAEPTSGVDVGARAAIYHWLRAEAQSGLPILICSSDLEDLVGVCHRVLVMDHGRVVDEIDGSDVTEAAILHSCGRERT